MPKEQYVLDKIEQWANKLPYKTLKIEIETRDSYFVLEKTKQNPIGFRSKEVIKC